MNQITYKINLDTHKASSQISLQGFQTGDRSARDIEITLREGTKTVELTENLYANVVVIRPNGSKALRNCTIDGNKIIFTVDYTDLTQSGTVNCQLEVNEYRLDSLVSTLYSPRFSIEVQSSLSISPDIQQSSDYSALQQYITKILSAYNKSIKAISKSGLNLVFTLNDNTSILYNLAELSPSITVGTVTSGATASVTNVGTEANAIFNFVLPKGDKGDKGDQGDSSTITIGQVTSGNTPSVTNVGTSSAAVLDFVLPKGDKGDTGDNSTISVGTVTSGSTASVTNVGTTSDAVFDFVLPKGDKGDTGNNSTISVGTVTSGSTASVTNVGTTSDAVFDFVLPKGDKGDTGEKGADGTSFVIKASYSTYDELVAAHPIGNEGDAYFVGSSALGTVFLWDVDRNTWDDIGAIKGDKGDKGDTGSSATIEVGSTTTVSPGQPIRVENDGDESNAILHFYLPSHAEIADSEHLGVSKPDGTTITIDDDGTLHGATTYTLPTASTTEKGGVKVDGDTTTIDDDGVIHAKQYTLPTASSSNLGGVKVSTSTSFFNLSDGKLTFRYSSDELAAKNLTTSTGSVYGRELTLSTNNRNKIAKIGTDTLTTTATTLTGAVNELKTETDKIGTDTLTTTATTLTGAVNELKTETDKIGTDALETTAQTLIGAVNEVNTSKMSIVEILNKTVSIPIKAAATHTVDATLTDAFLTSNGYKVIFIGFALSNGTQFFSDMRTAPFKGAKWIEDLTDMILVGFTSSGFTVQTVTNTASNVTISNIRIYGIK